VPSKVIHHALFYLSSPTPQGTAALAKILSQAARDTRIHSVSSVYKQYAGERADDLNSKLICVLRVETDLTPSLLYQAISSYPGAWTLLVFDQIVALTPNLPIPHPALFEDPAVLRCASEVWGDYEHPILGQSLNELVRSVHSFENVEFFAQGRSVL
jgi:7,8-dihydro-6-hydroxymethylpterin-pyrophosphokinase